jgi:hypothetical protein
LHSDFSKEGGSQLRSGTAQYILLLIDNLSCRFDCHVVRTDDSQNDKLARYRTLDAYSVSRAMAAEIHLFEQPHKLERTHMTSKAILPET